MCLVLCIEHGVCHVWDILARIRLSSDINLLILEIERLLKVFEEAQETGRNSFLTRFCAFTLGETGTDGLFNPDHVGESVP